VEDEPRLRAILARALREAGYRVIVAGSGTEALELGSEAVEQTAILVTDLVMPGMGGRATAEALRRRHPALPVLFVSGYAEEDAHPGELDAATGFLSKPFSPATLLARVRELLDGARGADAPPTWNAAWRTDLATGIREVDHQHRELLVRIATLEGAARAGDLTQAEEALDYLTRYAAEHFATEERIMRELGYPQLEPHRALHEAFSARLTERKEAHGRERSPVALLVDLARWMEAWLSEHVLGADAELARFCRTRRPVIVPPE
jgi:hemerythrin-like metal-binding protein